MANAGGSRVMHVLRVTQLSVVALLVVPAWAQTAATDNCEPLRERIEANIASKGVTGFAVTVVDANGKPTIETTPVRFYARRATVGGAGR